jgi:hypothetical protein
MRTLNLRRSTFFLMVAVLLLTSFAYLGPLARPADARQPSRAECTYDGKIVREDEYPGVVVYWVCNISGGRRFWSIFDILERPYRAKTTRFAASTPPYSAYVTAGIAKGYGNGAAVGAYSLRHPNDAELVRDIGVRILVHNRTTGGGACSDTGWVAAHSSRVTVEITKNYPGTCGGSGYFETSAAGRFFSTSLDRWITNAWVQSGQVFLAAT